jgi:uncharacterized repeat protein (TIGR02059 family)
MKKITILFWAAINSTLLSGQIDLIVEGTTINNTVAGAWTGVNIPRNQATNLIYRNNSITSLNSSGYMLQAGDESPLATNNNLDGEVITGNKFSWTGPNDPAIITHGVFTGYNINSVVKYNYLENVPYGIIFKSGTDAGVNMAFTSGGCAYNVCKNGKFAARLKGINGLKFYNNTFYSGDEAGSYLLLITSNTDRSVPAPSTGTKVFNNIFYTTKQIPMIQLESGSLTNFESDYNVFWCSAGEPVFNIDGATVSWTQWRARGYDAHSVIVDPDFINTTDFVPRSRLNYGINLGTDWQTGLSTTATWIAGSAPGTANQNGTWQVGACIYEGATVVPPSYVSSVVENAKPSVVEITYDLNLANIIPSASAFSVMVNSLSRTINSVSITGNKVQLTLSNAISYGDIVTLSYTEPSTNPIQTSEGGMASSISDQPILNNLINSPITVPAVTVKMTISPNHVHNIINIILEYSGSLTTQSNIISPLIIRVKDITGKLYLEQPVVKGITNIRFPVNLKPGVYIVLLSAGGQVMNFQKIVAY